jgi:hypothetical protein
MKKFLPDLIAILAFIILSFAYFFPADIEGRILFQHDTVAGVGAINWGLFACPVNAIVFCISILTWAVYVAYLWR